MPKPQRQILVCTNARPAGHPQGSCAEKGSGEVAERLKDLVREAGLRDFVMVNRTSCLKHCSQGTTIAVQPDNVWYARVGSGDLEQICEEHLKAGRPVERLFMPDIPWE
jgi:(2Fe-2S) ferredoxin